MAARSARVRALAKVNLELRVLGRRSDGYHELRTVFQTISLADTIDIAFTPARRTAISVTADVEIPGGNIMERAAGLALDAMRTAGRVEMRLRKRIPMGAGLGGGSSDAAAVLLALPVLAGKTLTPAKLMDLAAALAATCRSSCWVGPRWVWGGARRSTRCPTGRRLSDSSWRPAFMSRRRRLTATWHGRS